MPYRMIAIDLDGTLLASDGTVPPRAKAAIHECLAAGLLVCFATGRNWTESKAILETVQQGGADAGLIIHEAQLTYNKVGFHRVLDMGKWWKEKYDLPLPLGGNVLLRSLPKDVKSECCRMMRESIEYALDNHAEALEYALQFARDMDPRLAEKFVGMYVNHYTVDAGELIPKAVKKLLDLGYEVGLIPTRTEIEFAR